ncbi:hypothetical protein OAH12_03190, partial [Cyclobacteriaceae bacterium]|nr:hypothetical protein [Cyclobacteriaceae bacterium]
MSSMSIDWRPYLIALGCFWVLYTVATPEGITLTDDSKQFLYAAQSFHETGVLKEIGEAEFVHWPPLYPIFISLFSPNMVQAQFWVNGLCWSFSLV